MEFRSPVVAAQLNARASACLTGRLSDSESGRRLLSELVEDLGNATDFYPDWHPILAAPKTRESEHVGALTQLKAYDGIDHTVEFVKGFITCPYDEQGADRLVNSVNTIKGLCAYRPQGNLYADSAYPVVVFATEVELEADGTIRGRDALAWFTLQSAKEARHAQVGETWWNIRSNILGGPHGSRSSLFVNQNTGLHMRKILEALNSSGMFGPIKESSLAMLSQKNATKSVKILSMSLWTIGTSRAKNLSSSYAERHARPLCAIRGMTDVKYRSGSRLGNTICSFRASITKKATKLPIPIREGNAS